MKYENGGNKDRICREEREDKSVSISKTQAWSKENEIEHTRHLTRIMFLGNGEQ